MGYGLKILSLLTGSKEETLLNARAEISHAFGSKSISNPSEKNFVINTLIEDLGKYIDFEKVDKNNISPYEIIASLINRRLDNKESEFLVIFNRVMVHYYGMKLGDEQTFIEALVKLTDEIGYIISNDYF